MLEDSLQDLVYEQVHLHLVLVLLSTVLKHNRFNIRVLDPDPYLIESDSIGSVDTDSDQPINEGKMIPNFLWKFAVFKSWMLSPE
jgi:hypothetical protein